MTVPSGLEKIILITLKLVIVFLLLVCLIRFLQAPSNCLEMNCTPPQTKSNNAFWRWIDHIPLPGDKEKQ